LDKSQNYFQKKGKIQDNIKQSETPKINKKIFKTFKKSPLAIAPIDKRRKPYKNPLY